MATGGDRHPKLRAEPSPRRRGATQLGSLQRRLLLYIAAQEAEVRRRGSEEARRTLRDRGLKWEPAKMVGDADYSRTIQQRISRAMKTLTQRELVITFGGSISHRRTGRVRLTDSGWVEAMRIAAREGQSPTRYGISSFEGWLRSSIRETEERLRVLEEELQQLEPFDESYTDLIREREGVASSADDLRSDLGYFLSRWHGEADGRGARTMREVLERGVVAPSDSDERVN